MTDATQVPSTFNVEAALRDMFQTQLQVNNKQGGADWIQKTLSGERSFIWAIYNEIGIELYKSMWENEPVCNWWKKVDYQPDFLNAQIEIVDAWHFGMSHLLVQFSSSRSNLQSLTTEEILEKCVAVCKRGFELAKDFKSSSQKLKWSAFVSNLVTGLFGPARFFELCLSFELPLPKLYAMYQGKAELNKFRSDNGYKEGRYHKLWDKGEEDNTVLFRWLTQQESASKEQIRSFLETTYADFLQNNPA